MTRRWVWVVVSLNLMALLALVWLLISIFSGGLPAFKQSFLTFPVTLEESVLDKGGKRDPAVMAKATTVTLTNPNDGCVPVNIFGIGQTSPEAIQWLHDKMYTDATYKQDSAEFMVNGEIFDGFGAGPAFLHQVVGAGHLDRPFLHGTIGGHRDAEDRLAVLLLDLVVRLHDLHAVEFIDVDLEQAAGTRMTRHDQLASVLQAEPLGDHEELGSAAIQLKASAIRNGALEFVVLEDGEVHIRHKVVRTAGWRGGLGLCCGLSAPEACGCRADGCQPWAMGHGP